MAVNRQASPTTFGFDFQVNAAIVLMLENIKDLQSLRIEGRLEDIELKLNNDEYILAQAKSIVKSSSDFKNVRANLKKAIHSLSDGNSKCKAQQLILITNSPNPLNEDTSRNLFLGMAHRTYDSLPGSSRAIIDTCIKDAGVEFDTDKFVIKVVPFETDNDDEKYKMVRQRVDDFRVLRK